MLSNWWSSHARKSLWGPEIPLTLLRIHRRFYMFSIFFLWVVILSLLEQLWTDPCIWIASSWYDLHHCWFTSNLSIWMSGLHKISTGGPVGMDRVCRPLWTQFAWKDDAGFGMLLVLGGVAHDSRKPHFCRLKLWNVLTIFFSGLVSKIHWPRQHHLYLVHWNPY